MIKTLHVMGRMASGGTEHQLVGMLKTAHGKHWEATLCVLSSGWKLSEKIRAAGVPVVELDGIGKVDLRRAAALRRLASRFDVVHASLPGASAFARIVTAGPKRPAVVVSERGVEDHRSSLGVVSRLLRPMTDAFIGNSPAVIDFIRTYNGIPAGDPRLAMIPNGIDAKVFYPVSRGARPERHPRRLVAVGRLIPSKRFELAISLLPLLKQNWDVELVIVGDGPERRRLESVARGLPVSFLGHVSDRDTLADTLRGSDVLLMPSISEGYPNAVLEALACGISVVATDVPGNRAVAGTGVQLVAGDADEWCRGVLAALNRSPLTPGQVADRMLSFDEVARRHRAVFEAALSRRRGATVRGQIGFAGQRSGLGG